MTGRKSGDDDTCHPASDSVRSFSGPLAPQRTTSVLIEARGPLDLDTQQELIERAQAGDPAAFQALVRDELPRVRRFARAFCARPADADDIAQEALLKAYQAIGRYRQEARFSTWLYRIVRNSMIDWARSAYNRRRAAHDPYPDGDRIGDGGETPEDSLHRGELREQLWQALRALPQEFRTVVVLFEVEGLSHDQIADIEGIAVGTVKSRLSRARARLREALVTKGVLPGPGNEPASEVVLPSGRS